MGFPPRLVMRASVGAGFGAGHVSRCLSLGEEWVRRRGDAVLLAEELPPFWVERAASAGVRVQAGVADGDWTVVDGYTITVDERLALAAGGKLLLIDDFAESPHGPADLVLDQNPGPDDGQYGELPLLHGLRYALLPADRRSSARTQPDVLIDDVPADVQRILVAFGGFPTDELRALAEAALDHAGLGDRDVVWADGTINPAEVLPEVDMAFSAAGSFCWELCRFGVAAVVVSLARNQEQLAALVADGGLMVNGGRAELGRAEEMADALRSLAADREQRRRTAELGPRLVDGWGSTRVVSHLRAALLTLRPVEMTDADQLLAWRTDAATREASFNSDVIAADQHVQWLAERIVDPSSRQWIARDAEGTVGVVRFEHVNDVGEDTIIGVTVAPSRRGEGLAAALILAGCKALAEDRVGHESAVPVIANIKAENERSIQAFRAADFDFSPDRSTATELVYCWDGRL